MGRSISAIINHGLIDTGGNPLAPSRDRRLIMSPRDVAAQRVKNTHSFQFASAGTGYVQCQLGLTGFPRTIAAWVYPINNGTNCRAIMFLDSSSVNSGFYFHYTGVFSGMNASVAYNLYTISMGAWHFVAITHASSALVDTTTYLDGVAATYSATGSVHSQGGTLPGSVDIGGRHGNAAFQGYINDVAVWNKVLSAAEIASLYATGKPRNLNYNFESYASAENLRGWWRADEASWGGSYFDVPNLSRFGGGPGKSANMVSGDKITTVP